MDKEARKYKKKLEELTRKVILVLAEFDVEMKKVNSPKHGERLANIMNTLDYSNVYAMHFGLGWGFKKIANFKDKLG